MKLRGLLLSLILFVCLLAPAHGAELPLCREQWQSGAQRIAAGESYAAFRARLQRPACAKEWTVLVYMAADNDLFPYALWDLYEMEAPFAASGAAASTLKTDLVVQVNGPAADDQRRLHMFAAGEPYSIKQKQDFVNGSLDRVRSPVVARVPETGTPEARLTDFLLWAAKEYPSRHYLVVVWGHGQGWRAYPVSQQAEGRTLRASDLPGSFPSATPDPGFGGIAFEKSSGRALDIPALRSALRKFRAATGRPIDVYAADSCLMQMLEVAHELSDEARFLVGTTQVQSYLGLPYRRLLYELNTGRFNGERNALRPSADGSDEPLLLARMLPGLTKQSLDPRRGSQGRSDQAAQARMTSGAVSATEAKQLLVPELKRLGEALRAFVAEDFYRGLDLQVVLPNVPAIEGAAQDLGIFLGLLETVLQEERSVTGALSPAALRLAAALPPAKAALDRAVLSYAYGDDYGVDSLRRTVGFVPRALSLWLPSSAREYSLRRGEFLRSRFFRDTDWSSWLDLVYPR